MLRRYGHISEQAPGNIASTLIGPARQARPGAYLAQGSQQSFRDVFERSVTNQAVASFLSSAQNGQGASDNSLTQGLLQSASDPYAPWQPEGAECTSAPEMDLASMAASRGGPPA